MKEITWKTITKPKAEELFNDLDLENITLDTDRWSEDYIELRGRLLEEYNKVDKKSEYEIDLNFGLKLYHILGTEYKFTVSDASIAGIWYDLSLRTVPDIVAARLKSKSKGAWYERTTRIWLFRIWWYIHLSWQGSEEKTREVLRKNTTDTISAIVERSGVKGYRVDLLREIMKKYSECPAGGRDLLRAAMVRNSAWLLSQEPALADGGISGYAETLFEIKEK